MSDEMQINDGGPAFPCPKFAQGGDVAVAKPIGGMSLRDYFAAAMAPELFAMLQGNWKEDKEISTWADRVDLTASLSYELADAMLLARLKQ